MQIAFNAFSHLTSELFQLLRRTIDATYYRAISGYQKKKSKNVFINICPEGLPQRGITIMKCQLLWLHSGKQAIIIDNFPSTSGLEF